MSFLGSAVLVAACSPHRVTHNPAPPLQMPPGYSSGATQAAAAPPETWWKDFGDDTLDRLVARSLGENFQLRAAWARVKQSRALLTRARSLRMPQIDLGGQAARSQQRFNMGQEITVESNRFAASVGAGYEIDLWRRMANLGDAAALDALAMRDDLEAIAITLAAEVTEVWFDLLAQEAQRALVRQQLEVNRDTLGLVELRFARGLVSVLDVHQQRQQVAATNARLALIDQAASVFEHRLALLIGATPEAVAPLVRGALGS